MKHYSGNIAEYAVTSRDWVPELEAKCTTFGSNAQFVAEYERDVSGPMGITSLEAEAMPGAILLKVITRASERACVCRMCFAA